MGRAEVRARNRAWDDSHNRLPDGWRVAPPSYDPGRAAWTVVARGPQPPGRRGRPEYVEAQGEDELAALTYLAVALEERRGAERRVEIGRRARMAYISGAEEESRRMMGRGLRSEELKRVVAVSDGG